MDAKKFFWINSGSSVDSDYAAIIARATTLGYTLPSVAQRTKQENFVKALKVAGIWSSLDVLYVFATDGDQNFSFLNWKTPTANKITKSGTVTFTANVGNAGNGTNGYLDTLWIPSDGPNYVLNNASHFCYIQNSVTENKYDYGSAWNFVVGTGLSAFKSSDGFGGYATSINQSGNMSFTIASMVGLWHTKRIDASNNYLYKNGVQIDTDADASNIVSPAKMFLLAVNAAGSASNFATKNMSLFGAGASLDGKESALNTAWNTYFTSL